MRKKFLSLLLALALCVGLAVPALAEGTETRVGFIVGGGGTGNFYPYGQPASGAGWSYDGNQTFTFNGITLSGKNADMFQLCNPDRNFTFFIAPGSVNSMGSLNTMYAWGSNKSITVTITGTGVINCSQKSYSNINLGGDKVIFSGPTANCGSFTCGDLTMNSGFIYTGSLHLGDGSALNGGGIEVKTTSEYSKAISFQSTYDSKWNPHDPDEAVGQKIVGQFVDQYGKPLQYKVANEVDADGDEYSLGTVYDSTGERATYARFGSLPEPTVGDFQDVKQSAWYADPVVWAIDKSITNGTSDTTFSPNATCTRGQIITFLYRAAGSPAVSGTTGVSDAGSTYYTDAVLWAAENGLFSGSVFSPDAPCTREMAVEFMWKYAGSPDAAKADFTDASSDAVNWAVEQGVTNGTSDTTFSPNTTCTRAQIVTFLYRAFA